MGHGTGKRGQLGNSVEREGRGQLGNSVEREGRGQLGNSVERGKGSAR